MNARRAPPPPRRQRGSLAVLAGLGLFAGCALLLLAITIAEGMHKRETSQDLADALARIALANQLSYRGYGNPDTPALLRQVLTSDWMVAQLGTLGTHFDVTYQFGVYDEASGTFTAIARPDPEPGRDPFDAVALEVRADVASFGILQDLLNATPAPARVSGRALYAVSPSSVGGLKSCYCNRFCTLKGKCPGSGLLGLLACDTCLLGCGAGFLVSTLLSDVVGLLFRNDGNLSGTLAAIACLLEDTVQVVGSAWNWLFGSGSVTL